MQQRELGRTGLQVTPLGLGLAALGRPAYINLGRDEDLPVTRTVETMREHTHHVLDEAWRLGIRYFDAARSYGKAEEFLGSWLHEKGLAPGEVSVGSKWGYIYTGEWQIRADVHEVKEHSLPVLNRQWDESQNFLGDYLDLYQVHSATLESGILSNTGVLNRLAELKAEGVIIGLSLSGAQQGETLRQAAALEIDGIRLFDSVQATFNLLERSAEVALQDAHEAGMGIIIKEALANGLLTPHNANNSRFIDQYMLLSAQAKRLDTTIDALALAGVLAQPWVDMVLSGAATPHQICSNAGALNVLWDDVAESAVVGLVEPPEQYWHSRDQLRWH